MSFCRQKKAPANHVMLTVDILLSNSSAPATLHINLSYIGICRYILGSDVTQPSPTLLNITPHAGRPTLWRCNDDLSQMTSFMYMQL